MSLAGNVATYIPEQDFAGPDFFTFATFEGFADSDLGIVSVTVGSPATLTTRDGDGDGISDFVEYALGLSPEFSSVNGATAPCSRASVAQTILRSTSRDSFHRVT